MSLRNVKFATFPSLLASSSASSSRASTLFPGPRRSWCQTPSAPACLWRECGRLTDSAPSTRYEVKLADFSSYSDLEHKPMDITDSNQDFWCSDDVTMIARSARGMPNSEALSSSRTAGASKVSSLFSHTSSRETGVGHVSIRSRHLDTEVELDRESVATTLFSSQSKREKRSRVKFCARVEGENLKTILERKVDSAVQGEEEAQQKLYQAEAKEAKI